MSFAWQDEAHTEHEIQWIWFPWKHTIDANSVTELFKEAEWLFPGSAERPLQLYSNILTSEIDGVFHLLFYKYKVCVLMSERFSFLHKAADKSLIQIPEKSKISHVFPLRQNPPEN